jgi:pyruvate dehydrogenase E1 component alpha subunit
MGPLDGLGSLADPTAYRDPIALADTPPDTARAMLRRMRLIRRVEEVIAGLVESGEARCPCHLAIGQEATAVGVGFALDPHRDRCYGAHRAHAQYLALGADMGALLAEILGRDTGCSRGMGGSMHLAAPERGLMGTVPIVGATVPFAVGAGLALKMDGNGGVGVAFFGDGATEEGVVHESLNLASSMGLPVVFACDNNLFSSHLHIALRQPCDRVSRFAEAHRIAAEVVDGNDVVAVWRAAQRAVARARDESRPTFLEMVTYRWRGHVGHREDIDVGVKRGEDLPQWKARDPIRRLSEALVVAGLESEASLARLGQEVSDEVDGALAAARAAPYPPADAMERYLFAPRGTR